MEKRIQVNLNYIRPNSSLIYPLYDKNGENVLKERTILSSERLAKIKVKYGTVLFCDEQTDRAVVPNYRLNIALHQSRDLMEEISTTGKLSKSSFRGLEQVVDEMVSDLMSSDIELLRLIKEMKSEDEYLYCHAVNVGLLAGAFAKNIGCKSGDIKQITLGGFLIDIGHMMQDRQYLDKKSSFSTDERHKMMRHPQLGYEVLKQIPGIHPMVLQAVLFHHERFNDSGYFHMPYAKLPETPKIVAVCDMYDAFTTDRPYRDGMTPEKALRVLLNSIDIHFDQYLIGSFINRVGAQVNHAQSFYGTNEICELNTQELALVREIGAHDLLKPKVLVFCRFEKAAGKLNVKFFDKPLEVDLEDDDRFMAKMVDNPDHLKLVRKKLIQRGIIA